MRNPLLPPLMLLILAVGLYLIPDGSFYSWQLTLRGAFARLYRPPEPRVDAQEAFTSTHRDLIELLHQKDVQLADLHRRLRDLAVTRDDIPDVFIIPARVVRLGPDNNLDTYTIDVGSEDGATPGMAVVVGQALVGIIVHCEEDASLVLSLASTGCYVSARLGGPEADSVSPRLLAGVRGAGVGAVRAVVYSSGTDARDGWLALTSGLEPAIPADLIIGVVSGYFADGEEANTVEANIRPAVDLSSLDYVAVVGRVDAGAGQNR